MADSLKASEWGLTLIDRARRIKRWNKTSSAWCRVSYTSRSTLNRFWSGAAIRSEAFVAICEAVGVPWQDVAEPEDNPADEAASSPSLTSVKPPSLTRQDWGDAPAINDFYGRLPELQLMSDWMLQDHCRLIMVLGMGGMGKTALAANLSYSLTQEFEWVIWRSLRNAPSLEQLLTELIQFFSCQQETAQFSDNEQRLRHLMTYLRNARCLIVLDNAESILQGGDHQSRYLAGYEGYGEFFRWIGETAHPSCLLLTSREQPQGLIAQEGLNLPVRCLRLEGLPLGEGRELFQTKGQYVAQEQDWHVVIQRYAGNPLAIKIVASAIRDYFDSDIGQFLAFVQQGPFIFDDIRDLLARQFGRLTACEQEVMYWLAINREPLSFADLKANLVKNVALNDLMPVLVSLQRRSLIEKTRTGFTQQPVVMEFVTRELIEGVTQEMVDGAPNLLRTHALVQAQAQDYIRHAQESLILQPITNKLLDSLGTRATIESHCQQLLAPLHGQPCQDTAYIAGNLLHVLQRLEMDLSGYDLSSLTVWQANLQGENLAQVNFKNADLSRTVFTEILGNILAATFSPDGKLLATCDNNYNIRLWTVKTGQQVTLCQGHQNWIRAIAFSPQPSEIQGEGYLLASACADHTVKLWQVSTGRCLRTLVDHTHEVFSVAFNHDGTLLASGSGDGTAKLWQTHSGQCLLTCEGHQGWIRAVAMPHQYGSQSEQLPPAVMVTGSEDQTIKIWDLATGECLQTGKGHHGRVRSVAFSHAGDYLASGSDDGTVKLWDLQTALCLQTYEGHRSGVYSVAFSPTAPILASGSGDQTVKLWDCQADQCLRTLQGHTNQIFSLAFHPDGQTLACVTLDQTVRLWNWQTTQCLRTWEGHTDWALPVAFHPQGHLIASSSGDSVIHLWDWQQQTTTVTLRDHRAVVRSLAFSDDGQYLISGGTDQTVRIWNCQTGRCEQTFYDHPDWVFAVAWSSISGQEGWFASGGGDPDVRLWSVETGQCQQVLQGHRGQVWSVAFSPDRQSLASGSTDKTVRLWDVQTGECLKVLEGHGDRIYSIAYHPDGQILASGSQDHTVKLWQVDTGECLQTLTDHESWIFAVAFGPSGAGQPSMLASGSHDHTIKLWDIQTGECLRTLCGHTQLVCSVAFSPDGQYLVSGSQDQSVRVWDIQTGDCLTVLTARLYEGMDITGAQGLTTAQRITLQTLGAIDGQFPSAG
ncbi:NB-ARC domain-containing protein [Acaryochloris marina NIES-2412]|uniref:WD40 domain-containing protein n=1 Tax=Acaryochloris marina TaxID=155978 RepID=UPI00405A218E